ncbi:hypothetical protein AOLI_G00106290 [Acnodon oligacanthus]
MRSGWSLKTAVKFIFFVKCKKIRTWSGYNTESGAELSFTLSPAEEDMLLLLCYGLCVWAEENTVTEHRAAGSSLILPVGHPEESVTFAQWRYEGKTFAVYRKGRVHVTDQLNFSGRLKVHSDDPSVEVTDLQLQDSGNYSITADTPGVQVSTTIMTLTVYGVSNSGASFSVFSLLRSLMAAFPYLLVSIVLGVK